LQQELIEQATRITFARTPQLPPEKPILVAFLFRQVFALIRTGGASALVAKNTISQGDTRVSGLQWICKNGGIISSAVKRLALPGDAAVGSALSTSPEARMNFDCYPDGRHCSTIDSFLFDDNGDDLPACLSQTIDGTSKG